ncbi:ferrochelatase [Enterococcus faecalis]
MNLGTPRESSKTEVRKYLKTFLSDRRVIKIHLSASNANSSVEAL